MVRLVLASIAIALALPASAGAEVFCAPAPCSEGTPSATIQAAIDAADLDPGADTVAIKAGTHNVGNGADVGQPDTDVRGAGVGQTIVTGNDLAPADSSSHEVFSGYMSALRDLTLRLPSAVTTGPSSWQGADVYNGLVEDVAIDAQGAAFGAGDNDGHGAGMLIRRGDVRRLEIDFPLSIDASGLKIGAVGGSPPVTLEDVTITAPTGIDSGPQADPDPITTTAKRMVVRSPKPLTVFDGYFELSDAVLDSSMAPPPDPGEYSAAVSVYDGRAPDPAGLTLDRVTFVGNGDADSAALEVNGQGASEATYVRARHIVVSDFGRTLLYANYGSDPAATIEYSNVETGPGDIVRTGPPGATLISDFTPGNVAGDPLLNADFSLGLASPAVDIGGAALLAGGPLDLAGNPRPADGDGNGSVLNDAGAYERQYAADGATLTIEGRKVKLNRNGVGKVRLTCPVANAQPPPCTAKLRLRTAKKVEFKGRKRKVTLAKTRPIPIDAGETKAVKVKVSAAKLALLEDQRKARRVITRAKLSDGNGERGTVSRKQRLKPKGG